MVGIQYDDPGSNGGDTLDPRGSEAEPATVAEAGREAADKAHLARGEPVQ